VTLEEPDPAWPETAAALMRAIRDAVGPPALVLQHAGSTAVPGLPAKPVIDLVLGVPDPTDEPAYVPALEILGYHLHIREPEWHEHRLLKRDSPTVNLHVFAAGSDEIDRMLAFRDHLREDATDRGLYLRTKRELAARTWDYVQDYADAKSDVVADIMSRAAPRRPPPLLGAFVLVTDVPGNAELPQEIATRLGLPLLSQAVVTAALRHAIGSTDAPPPSTTAAAAAELLLTIAATSGGAVLAAPGLPDRTIGLAGLPGQVVEVRRGADPPVDRPEAPWPVIDLDAGLPLDVDRLARAVRQVVA
jgi:GrpB-like predicted nucleotidyltransferase (UPF0157 family)